MKTTSNYDIFTNELIARAEIIDDLAFEPIARVFYSKKQIRRDQDLQDIAIIEKWQRNAI
jgi:hypothetical protein